MFKSIQDLSKKLWTLIPLKFKFFSWSIIINFIYFCFAILNFHHSRIIVSETERFQSSLNPKKIFLPSDFFPIAYQYASAWREPPPPHQPEPWERRDRFRVYLIKYSSAMICIPSLVPSWENWKTLHDLLSSGWNPWT